MPGLTIGLLLVALVCICIPQCDTRIGLALTIVACLLLAGVR